MTEIPDSAKVGVQMSDALNHLGAIVADDTYAAFRQHAPEHGSTVEALVREAIVTLDTFAGRSAPGGMFGWTVARRDLRARLAEMLEIVDESGITHDVRRLARIVIEMLVPQSAGQWGSR